MREIIFRGKRIEDGEWVEGCLTRYSQEMSYITVDLLEQEVYQVHTETVGQYTGLLDKNSKKIFEGDIINWSARLKYKSTGEVMKTRKRCVVEWRKVKAAFTLRSFSIPNGMEAMYMSDYEVIGNIHDNPELLEVQE